MTNLEIIQNLPYNKQFLFVDEIEQINEKGIIGNFTFRETENFYEGDFKNRIIIPSVLLTECMAQIGVGCLGIFLLKVKASMKIEIEVTNFNMNFYRSVFPNEKVTVHSEKIYFRFNKLMCKVRMLNNKNELVGLGEISGTINT